LSLSFAAIFGCLSFNQSLKGIKTHFFLPPSSSSTILELNLDLDFDFEVILLDIEFEDC